MRRKALVVLALVVCAFIAGPSAQDRGGAPFVAGEVLVKFRPGSSAAAQADAHRQAGGTRIAELSRIRVQRVSVAAGDELAAIARYRRNPNVAYAEPNFIRSVPSPSAHGSGTEVVARDAYFGEQWALHNVGQLFYCIPWLFGDLCLYIGTPDADIDAPEAWAISNGGAGVKVAVIDTGIDHTHPDLAANYAGGYDFVTPDSDPMDDHGHGTHVSGTVAAAINNLTGGPAAEEGVAGVAPNAGILAYKVCDSSGNCNDVRVADAILRAIDDGAHVINMSLGGTAFSATMNDAVQEAWASGLVIVAGAGNSGTTAQFYPAAFANVIAVGAYDEDHLRATFSNYGNWVDISAPGNAIMSTYPVSACGGLSATPGKTGCYTWNSGTSMASPHVAGAAALVWARGDVAGNAQVVDILLNSADRAGVAGVRLDSWTVHGGLNIHNALSYTGAGNRPPVANAGADQTVQDSDGDGGQFVTLDGTGSRDPEGGGLSYEWREGASFVALGPTPQVWLTVGVHMLTLEVTDDHGASSTDTVTVTVAAYVPPNAPPVANAGADQSVEDADADGGEFVMLDGTGSSDPDGGALTYEWREGGSLLAVGPTPYVWLSVGVHTLNLKVTDSYGASSTDAVTIAVSPAATAALSVTRMDPGVVSQSAGVTTFVITGSGFAPGAVVSFANGGGPAPRVLEAARDSATQITARIEIRSGGPPRPRRWDVVVANPDGATAVGAGLLTITP